MTFFKEDSNEKSMLLRDKQQVTRRILMLFSRHRRELMSHKTEKILLTVQQNKKPMPTNANYYVVICSEFGY